MIDFILLILIYTGIYSLLSLGLNLVTGKTGLLSLCHAAFFAIGAYTTAIVMTKFGHSYLVALILSMFMAGFLGLLIGIPTLRLRGDYLAIATLGFGEIIKNIILNWDSLTRGPMGINNIPVLQIFSSWFSSTNKLFFVLLIWILVLIIMALLTGLAKSRFGRAMEAIREDETAARAMGLNTSIYKVTAFTLGAIIAGIAGNLWAVYNQSVTPQTFDFMLSIMILCMVVLGGLGQYKGAILGTLIIVITSEIPRLLGFSYLIPAQFNQILFGLILVLTMIYRPQGLLKEK
ncbi:MAG: branched-chain amino acid ABC transporter permease [Candidatus Margulisbacteria bacterium]|nr:branched-chain amino acid ABC transporter permease [Candidatus Margulisiibacteriota bacterium]